MFGLSSSGHDPVHHTQQLHILLKGNCELLSAP